MSSLISNRKIKIICLVLIFSLFILVVFPWVAKSENSQAKRESEIEFLINSDTTSQFQETSEIEFSITSNPVSFTQFTKSKNNLFQKYLDKTKFSIDFDTVSCSKELIVYIDENKPLFCVQGTTGKVSNTTVEAPIENEKEIMIFDANNFNIKIKEFADNKNILIKDLTVDPSDYKNKDDENCLLKSSAKENYYYIRIGYNRDSDRYFNQRFFTKIIKIGRKSDLSIDEEWKKNADEWIDIRERVKECIQKAVNHYRNNVKSVSDREDSNYKLYKLEEQKKLELSKQAVRIPGKDPIFYIRTWNNGLSPSERAQRVSDKMIEIIKGDIDIQGLGIFEKPTKNTDDEQSIKDTSKVIKVISDSKFKSKTSKEIIEITYYDALFEGKDNVADLAQEYLVKINEFIHKYKKTFPFSERRGYPVTFLKKHLFHINTGLGPLKKSKLFQSSHRASEISSRIEKFVQKNSLLNPERLIVAYPVDEHKGLCILPESINEKDYKEFLAKNNPDEKNEDNCKLEDLMRSNNIEVIYSDEITKKINKRDWQLTNLNTTRKFSKYFNESSKYLNQELPKSIIFMELDEEMELGKRYELLIDIQFNELDPILHKDYKTVQELAIYFRDRVEEEVTAYIWRKRIWLVIFTVLLLTILQLVFKISSLIRKVFLATRKILFEDIEVTFQKSRSFLQKKSKILINTYYLNNKYSIVCKLFLIITIIIFILSTTPKLDFFINDFIREISRFLVDRRNVILSYISTEIPKIIFILFCAFILYQIITLCASRIKENIAKGEYAQTLIKSVFTIRGDNLALSPDLNKCINRFSI